MYLKGLLNNDDILILGDTDEMPSPDILFNLKNCEIKDYANKQLKLSGCIFYMMS